MKHEVVVSNSFFQNFNKKFIVYTWFGVVYVTFHAQVEAENIKAVFKHLSLLM